MGKLVVNNVPIHSTSVSMHATLNKILAPEVVKFRCNKAPRSRRCILTFSSEEDSKLALSKLDGYVVSGRTLQIRPVSNEEDIKWMSGKAEARESILLKIQGMSETEWIQNQVTKFWKLEYPQQLAEKQKRAQCVIDKVSKELGITPLIAQPTKPSPCVNGYRNKCEFSIGKNSSGNPAIGFTLGSFSDGIVEIGSPDPLLNVPAVMKVFVNHVQSGLFGSEKSLPVFDRPTCEGFWRILLVRLFDAGQMMVLFQVSEGFEQDVSDLLAKLCQSFSYSDQHERYSIASLFLQKTRSRHFGLDPNADTQIVFGSEHLHARLGAHIFRVGISAFFQTNVYAAEELYSMVGTWLSEGGRGNDRVLLDLCCGTGTIGICLSSMFRRVVGVEVVPEAIENARWNSRLNDAGDKSEWHCGLVEKILPAILKEEEEFVVVLDPPRAGVHPDVVRAIRSCSLIRTVVFIACQAELSYKNFIE